MIAARRLVTSWTNRQSGTGRSATSSAKDSRDAHTPHCLSLPPDPERVSQPYWLCLAPHGLSPKSFRVSELCEQSLIKRIRIEDREFLRTKTTCRLRPGQSLDLPFLLSPALTDWLPVKHPVYARD